MVATAIYSVTIIGYHCVVERNRISSLQSHGKALEKECCLPGVFLLLLLFRSFRCWRSREQSSPAWPLTRIARPMTRRWTQQVSSSLCQHHFVSRCLPIWTTAWWPSCRRTSPPRPTCCDERWKIGIGDLSRNDCLLRAPASCQAFSDIQVVRHVIMLFTSMLLCQ